MNFFGLLHSRSLLNRVILAWLMVAVCLNAPVCGGVCELFAADDSQTEMGGEPSEGERQEEDAAGTDSEFGERFLQLTRRQLKRLTPNAGATQPCVKRQVGRPQLPHRMHLGRVDSLVGAGIHMQT